MKKMYDEKTSVIRMRATFEDFDGGLEKWKESFYMVWRWQLTWNFAYSLKLNETRANGVLVDMLVKPAYRQNVLDMMKELGYQNISENTEYIGIVDMYGHDELEDIEALILD